MESPHIVIFLGGLILGVALAAGYVVYTLRKMDKKYKDQDKKIVQ